MFSTCNCSKESDVDVDVTGEWGSCRSKNIAVGYLLGDDGVWFVWFGIVL